MPVDPGSGVRKKRAQLARPGEGLLPPDPRKVGEEPDYRFTLANERTFLAWIRTALALSAGGLGALHLIPDPYSSALIGITLLGFSVATAATSYRRWALNETSMRLGRPLPKSKLPQVMAVSTTVIALLAAILFALDK